MSLSTGEFTSKKTLFQNVILDEDDMDSDSDKALATQQSIKAFVLANAGGGEGGGGGDITGVTAGFGLTGGGTSGSVTLNVNGGNGITANANDIAVTEEQNTITSVLNNSLVKPQKKRPHICGAG